jgi:hypothetical protein
MGKVTARVGGIFTIACKDSRGNDKWKWSADNMVVNAGLQHIIDVVFKASAQKTVWYIGLIAATPTIAAANTLASHAGWTEFTSRSGSRAVYSATRSNQTLSNNATKGSILISASGTVGGAFLCSTSTNTTGVLMCAVTATEGNRAVVAGDTISARYDFTAADA